MRRFTVTSEELLHVDLSTLPSEAYWQYGMILRRDLNGKSAPQDKKNVVVTFIRVTRVEI